MTQPLQQITMSRLVPRPFVVEGRRRETYDTVTIEAIPVGESTGVAFAAGQFNMLYLFGKGEVPISISGDPTEPDRLVHTARAVGAVTRALCGVKRGDIVGVRGPFGSPWPLETARGRDVVVVAGGIGLAPLRPAIYQLLARREEYGKICILYGARSPQDLLFAKQLERWRRRFDLEVAVTVDSAETDWRGHVGVVTTLIPRADFNPMGCIAMVCGPEVMMRFTVEALQKAAVSSQRIFLSMERNMQCAVGLCGHCQYGSFFVCKDGPVFPFDRIARLFATREV